MATFFRTSAGRAKVRWLGMHVVFSAAVFLMVAAYDTPASAQRLTAAAAALHDFILSERGQAILAGWGFGPPGAGG